MIAAGKRPDVAVKVRKELDDDGVSALRNEIALGDFEFVFLERARFGEKLIARTGCQHQKVRAVPLSVNTEARLFGGSVDRNDVGAANLAASLARAVKEQAVQDGARVDDDGMRHVERGALLIAGNQLDGVNEFLGISVFEQKREALNGFVGEAAAARLFPGEMLVKDFYRVTCAGKFRAAHGT